MVSSPDPNSEWLNTVAHDLKTPINSVRGCIELVKQLGPLNERQEHFANRAMAGLTRMEHLVSRLLDISWADAEVDLDLGAVSLKATIEETVNLLEEMAATRNISISIEFDSRIGRLLLDARRIAQVLDNLISNAIKYNHDGGSIIITVAHQGDQILISVQDTGLGISTEDQPRIFERFFRSRQGVSLKIEGSGLGLAITESIVQKHGGRIWFESMFGEGTTFYFTLPLSSQMADGEAEFEELSQGLAESSDNTIPHAQDAALEESDSVDDSLQENRVRNHFDESSDEN
ncbi:MAG: HAMP domain-containing sensor histidine kinase [Chloroflexota bacterium]